MKKIRIKDMIERSNIPAKLIRSAVNQLGGFESFKECAEDIVNHGIDGGFHGFIYYSDTTAFFKRNRHEIMEMAEDMSREFGQGVLEMIQGFNCMKSFSVNEIAKAVYTSKGEYVDQIQNCMAWFSGEEVSRLYCDLLEEGE